MTTAAVTPTTPTSSIRGLVSYDLVRVRTTRIAPYPADASVVLVNAMGQSRLSRVAGFGAEVYSNQAGRVEAVRPGHGMGPRSTNDDRFM
jgi:hypothetical protein